MIDYTPEELFNDVNYWMDNKIPVAITRAGDGEAMVLNGFNDMERIKMVMKRQFGFVPTIEHIEQIRENLIQAYRHSDVIGVPVDKRLGLGDYWYKTFELLSKEVGIETLVNKKLTSIDFHTDWLTAGHWNELFKKADTICYVSCRNLDTAFNRIGIKNVHSFIIAPEMKFTSGYSGLPHYPDQFEQIAKWMETIPAEGALCLVGAGFTGKIYNTWFKDRGGISIDSGCCFDMWAGKVTRGPERGLDKEDETYKL